MGLTTDTLVVLGSWDNYACALGGGVRKKNTFVTCLGTAGWVGVNNEKPLIADGFMSNVVYVGDGTYFTSVHSHSACAAYEWVVQNLCADLREKVWETGSRSGYGAGGAGGSRCERRFLPAVHVQRKYVLFRCQPRREACRAENAPHQGGYPPGGNGRPGVDLMMGVDFYKMMGVMTDEARLIGGGANNRLWMQILSNMFGVKMIRPKNLQYIGALGAALIAGVGAGLISSFDAVSDVIQLSDSAQPDGGEMEKYRRLLPVFKHFYESLMPAYKELSQFTF